MRRQESAAPTKMATPQMRDRDKRVQCELETGRAATFGAPKHVRLSYPGFYDNAVSSNAFGVAFWFCVSVLRCFGVAGEADIYTKFSTTIYT